VRCKCRSVRGDIKPFTSLRAAAGGVAISRKAIAEASRETPTCPLPYAVREIPTCTAPYAVRRKCRFARNDINLGANVADARGDIDWLYVIASHHQAAQRSPAPTWRCDSRSTLGVFTTLRWGVRCR
jgi:hypothetical protein